MQEMGKFHLKYMLVLKEVYKTKTRIFQACQASPPNFHTGSLFPCERLHVQEGLGLCTGFYSLTLPCEEITVLPVSCPHPDPAIVPNGYKTTTITLKGIRRFNLEQMRVHSPGMPIQLTSNSVL